jgi:hypothetical protein
MGRLDGYATNTQPPLAFSHASTSDMRKRQRAASLGLDADQRAMLLTALADHELPRRVVRDLSPLGRVVTTDMEDGRPA